MPPQTNHPQGQPAAHQSPHDILKHTFGYDAFRGAQEQIISRIIEGGNVLAIMPTGAGKSLCFQVPALAMRGMAVVVSPLIALMQNQVEALQLLGVEAATLNAQTSPEAADAIWGKIRSGTLKLLYISPERLMRGSLCERLQQLPINLIAIDEAHCISQWGAAFRPEYEDLKQLRGLFPNTPIIALTATADTGTRRDIEQKIFDDTMETVQTGFDRPNIRLQVDLKNSPKTQILRFLQDRPASGSENGIIYCLSRRKTEDICTFLSEKGFNACAYHAGMAASARETALKRFMREDDLIMVATIAFGMGIDKPDIRFVLHTDLPSSPEAYYQEIGRAGRDGEPAVAHMLYGMQDIAMRRMFVEEEDAAEEHKKRGHARLGALLAYCEAPSCRRVALLRYFGDTPDFERCGNCDLCTDPITLSDATTPARKFLSAIARTGESFGVGHLVDILIGKDNEKIRMRGHNKLPTFGIGTDFADAGWRSLARQLMAAGHIMPHGEYGALRMTETGRTLMRGETSFEFRADRVRRTGGKKRSTRAIESHLDADAQRLFDALKGLRRELAADRGVPAYMIFSNASLEDMAINRPLNLSEFADIQGVGSAKLDDFGTDFVAFIRDHERGSS